jgi:putative DNA primase/helicase
VFLVDGEMPGAELQKRLKEIQIGAARKPENGFFRVLVGDLEDLGIGNLADPKVQARIDAELDGADVVILDNLSSLTTVIRDNDQDSWSPIQAWLLRLRRRGISVVIIHHAGKGGDQRGTSKREDVLDTSISLRRPPDYNPTEGARFEVHIEKGRGILGNDAKPFEAMLTVLATGETVWTIREIDDVNLARVRALAEDTEMSIRDIASETGIPKSTVSWLIKKHNLRAAKGDKQDEE